MLSKQVPPIVNMLSTGQDGNYTLTGSGILFIELLAAKLNFTYIFKFCCDFQIFIWIIRCILHNRLTYYYIPNNMTKVKYGNMSDFAILINLLVNKVIIAKNNFFIRLEISAHLCS